MYDVFIVPEELWRGGREGGRGNRDLTHKKSLHGDVAAGKLLLQYFLGAFRAYGRAGVKMKNFTLKRFPSKRSRVDHTLTRKLVVIKFKVRQLDTISKWFWNLTCQKGTLRNSRQHSMMDHALTRELVVNENKFRQLDTISKWFWNLTHLSKIMIQQNFEAKVYMDHTLTSELVLQEI